MEMKRVGILGLLLMHSGMKEVGDDVFTHPYLSGVFLASPGDAFALWVIPVSRCRVQLQTVESFIPTGLEKWKIPSQGPENHSPGRTAVQQEPKHSDA
ncbi:hypothetical protein CEXT_774391 [Caerostris extrusa]|uniref:Uncharacterized protein n=1 Tax=Caerostris extrusa TaxID=172846 RepID=A0AAV4X4U9_CAEEX|nr:hypothetical protein CEXT_774391 [Caerostris extrusa]